VEAARHWRRVRALTDKLQQSPEAAELGINARVMLLGFLFRLGAASEEGEVRYEEEAAAVFAEAEAFAKAAGQTTVRVMVRTLYGLVCVTSGGEAIEAGYQHTAEAVRLADQTGDAALRAVSRASLAWALFVLGRVREAAAVAAEMVPIIGEDRSVGRGMAITSPYAWCRMQMAHFGAYTHRLDDGLADLERSIDLACQEGDLETQAWAHRQCSVLADLAGTDPDAAAAHALQGLEWADAAGGAWSRIRLREGVAISHVQRGLWRPAIEVVEEALAIARDRRISLADVPLLLAIRARAQIGLGDLAGARSSAEEAIGVAVRCGTRMYEALARLELARAILADLAPGEETAAGAELNQALSIVETLGIRSLAPQIHLERAHLAQVLGDETTHDAELRTAHRVFLEVGAQGRAEEIASLVRSR
jgi:tetratricopeptide (TPR) repeat protein